MSRALVARVERLESVKPDQGFDVRDALRPQISREEWIRRYSPSYAVKQRSE